MGNGNLDVVFLIDATASMQYCIDAVKDNVFEFFQSLTNSNGNSPSPIKDWRAKIVGFRDYEEDGPEKWLVDNSFTRDVSEVKQQLSKLIANGGGDIPESLLDAICTVIDVGSSTVNEESPQKWRERHEAVRAIVAITDAPYKPYLAVPKYVGACFSDIVTKCHSGRFLLSIIHPEGLVVRDKLYGQENTVEINGDALFARFGSIDKYNDFPIHLGSDGRAPLNDFFNNKEKVKRLLQALGKTISKTATAQSL